MCFVLRCRLLTVFVCLAVFAFVYATGPVEVSHIDDLIALNQETCPAATTAHIVRARDSLHTCVLVCLATLPAVLALTVWYGWRATASASRELDLVSTVDLAQIDVEVGEEPPIALDAPADCQAGDADSTASSGTARRRRGCGVSQACQPWFALTMVLVVALLASQCYALVVNATASAEIDAFYESARGLGGQCLTRHGARRQRRRGHDCVAVHCGRAGRTNGHGGGCIRRDAAQRSGPRLDRRRHVYSPRPAGCEPAVMGCTLLPCCYESRLVCLMWHPMRMGVPYCHCHPNPLASVPGSMAVLLRCSDVIHTVCVATRALLDVVGRPVDC